VIDLDVLARIAVQSAELTPSYADTPATYIGTEIPFHGIARITSARDRISAEIDDVEGWEHQAARLLPNGSPLPTSLFRQGAPGKLIGEQGRGQLTPDEGDWAARHVINNGYHMERGRDTRNLSTFQFYVGELEIRGAAYGSEVAATREIYAGGELNHNTEFRGEPLLIRALSHNAPEIAQETLGITIAGNLADLPSEAIWLWASFISGNRLGAICKEYFAEDGSLIRRIHRRGRVGDYRQQYFRPFYAPFSADGAQRMAEGIARLLDDAFPIEVVLDHLFQAGTGNVDVDAIHLVLSYHTAIEAWNRRAGYEDWIDDNVWERFAKCIRKRLIPEELYETVGAEMKDNIRTSLAHANDTTTAWRQENLFKALNIDVSGADGKRIVDMRNELLHNGYFLTRWNELSHDQSQHRHDDVGRLRRLALFVIFRLTGYEGTFQDPVTFAVMNIGPPSERAEP
jgi:hypothetical protein